VRVYVCTSMYVRVCMCNVEYVCVMLPCTSSFFLNTEEVCFFS